VLKLDANTTSCCTSTTGTTAGMDMDTVTTGNDVPRPLSRKKKAEKERDRRYRCAEIGSTRELIGTEQRQYYPVVRGIGAHHHQPDRLRRE
jgi:hypothetical protein